MSGDKPLGPDDSTPVDFPRVEPVTRSFLERLQPPSSRTHVVLATSLVVSAAGMSATVSDPVPRTVLQLVAGVLVFLIGWLAPQPKGKP